MNISSIGGGTSQAAGIRAGETMDAQSRNIQKQITDAQKRLQEVSSNGELSPEEKMKKRQEIQKEISDLKIQLRQHQMEVKRQKQEERKASANETFGGKQNAEGQSAGLSSAGMQAVISADTSMKQAKVQNGVAVKMEGKAGVLEAEIKQDGGTGGNTESKEAELAEVKQKAADAEASQMKTLKEANRKMREAAGKGQEGKTTETAKKGQESKTTETATEAGKAEEKAEEPAVKAENVKDMSDEISSTEKAGEKTKEADDASGNTAEKMPGMYVDVRL